MTTWSARPSSSAGPDVHGPVTASSDRHDARRRRQRPGHPAPGVERRHALVDVGAGGGQHRRRSARRARWPASTSRRWPPPRPGRSHPRCLPPSRRNQRRATSRSPSRREAVRRGRQRRPAGDGDAREQAADRLARGRVTAAGRRTSVALWPPNPNEFDSAGPADRARLAGDDVDGDLGIGAGRGWRSAAPARRGRPRTRRRPPPRRRRR